MTNLTPKYLAQLAVDNGECAAQREIKDELLRDSLILNVEKQMERLVQPRGDAAQVGQRAGHYGSGKQPWDDIVDAGWGPAFAAGNVLKYLRRNKEVEDSQAKARWYWHELKKLADETLGLKSLPGLDAFVALKRLLEPNELKILEDTHEG